MLYGDIIPIDVITKLMMVSFKEPSTNLRVFKFSESLKPLQAYVLNERNKLVERYGSVDENGSVSIRDKAGLEKFQADFANVLSQEIHEHIVDPELTEDEFSSENCSYPIDKKLWLSAVEIGSILNFCDKIKSMEV